MGELKRCGRPYGDEVHAHTWVYCDRAEPCKDCGVGTLHEHIMCYACMDHTQEEEVDKALIREDIHDNQFEKERRALALRGWEFTQRTKLCEECGLYTQNSNYRCKECVRHRRNIKKEKAQAELYLQNKNLLLKELKKIAKRARLDKCIQI